MPAATVDHSQKICEVWASNLEEEMKRIRQVTRKFSYVAMVSLKHKGFIQISRVSCFKCDLGLTVYPVSLQVMKSNPYVDTAQLISSINIQKTVNYSQNCEI